MGISDVVHTRDEVTSRPHITHLYNSVSFDIIFSLIKVEAEAAEPTYICLLSSIDLVPIV